MVKHITLIFICLYLEAYNLKLTFNNLSNGRNANYVYISSMVDCIFPRQLQQYMPHLTYFSCNVISTLDQDPFLFFCPLSDPVTVGNEPPRSKQAHTSPQGETIWTVPHGEKLSSITDI